MGPHATYGYVVREQNTLLKIPLHIRGAKHTFFLTRMGKWPEVSPKVPSLVLIPWSTEKSEVLDPNFLTPKPRNQQRTLP